MKRIHLLLIEDNRLLREGIISLFKKHDDLHAVTVLGTNEHILQKIRSFKPTILLLDIGLRSQNSLQLVKAVVTNSPATKVIVMNLIPADNDIWEFVRAGVSGFILKDAIIDDVLKTIRLVDQGEKVLPSLMTESLFTQIIKYAVNGAGGSSAELIESVRITRRERQVIELIYKGMTNKERGEQLHLSPYTVKCHVHNILEKLAFHTRIQIAKYAHTSERSQEKANTITE